MSLNPDNESNSPIFKMSMTNPFTSGGGRERLTGEGTNPNLNWTGIVNLNLCKKLEIKSKLSRLVISPIYKFLNPQKIFLVPVFIYHKGANNRIHLV